MCVIFNFEREKCVTNRYSKQWYLCLSKGRTQNTGFIIMYTNEVKLDMFSFRAYAEQMLEITWSLW